ncbi:unnamed protein product [Toxocara canis]|uniref:DUF1768 domain-containing protein n=1 Tax=Toxocara canis TaxID=6265 RepID=A0A183UAK6_TOXCA|nr:unnamed protein product [Toxocara canis]
MTLRQSDKEGSAFTFFYTNKSQFSNFYPCTFTVLNETGHPLNFTSSEQYFMHQKAITFKDDAVAQRILQSTSPAEAKALGRKVRNFDAKVWDALSFDVMKRGVFEKFSQNEDLRKELFSTIGSTMVECSPRDRLWGIGIGINDERRMIPSRWKGHNRLGKVLMEVRDQLSESEDFRDEVIFFSTLPLISCIIATKREKETTSRQQITVSRQQRQVDNKDNSARDRRH